MERRTQRTVRFTYEITVPPSQSDTYVWVPRPLNDEWQRELGAKFPELPREEGTDPASGNRSVRVTVPKSAEPRRIEISYDIERKLRSRPAPAPAAFGKLEPKLDRWLKANKKVPLDGVIGDDAKKLGAPGDPAIVLARRAFDHLLQTLEYDAAGCTPERFDQLGNLEVACDIRKGTCTEFHGLLVGYLRALSVPARFTFGFNIPRDKTEGAIKGYHCWSEVLLPDREWFSIDVSEGWKAKSKGESADFYFGSVDADRIAFTHDRDLDLAPKQQGGLIDKFIFPYAESNGAELRPELSFRFEELKT